MTLANLLSLVSTLAIVAAGIFVGLQVRQLNKQRARDPGWQLLRSFQTPDFVNAVNIVFDLPEGLSRSDSEHRLGSKLTNILVMFWTSESLRLLVLSDISRKSEHRAIAVLITSGFSGWSSNVNNENRKNPRFLRSLLFAIGSPEIVTVAAAPNMDATSRLCAVAYQRDLSRAAGGCS